jgi:hypothetical protein
VFWLSIFNPNYIFQTQRGWTTSRILLLVATVEEMELRPISSTVAASNSIGWQYLKLYVKLRAPDDGRRNRLKHVERL